MRSTGSQANYIEGSKSRILGYGSHEHVITSHSNWFPTIYRYNHNFPHPFLVTLSKASV
jgi:hypothetical protein